MRHCGDRCTAQSRERMRQQHQWWRIGVLGFWMLAGTLFSNGIAAQETRSAKQEASARDFFQQGLVFYEAGQYIDAANSFIKSYEITGEEGLLYNIGRCYEADGQTERAVSYYRRYLEKNPQATDRPDVERRVAELDVQTSSADKAKGTSSDRTTSAADADGESLPLRFGLLFNLGPGFTILSPQLKNAASSRHAYFGIDLWPHIFFKPWVALVMGLSVGKYIKGGTPFVLRDATTHVGFGAGVAFHFDVKSPRLFLPARVIAIPTFINRDGVSSRATWIDFQGALGLGVRLPKSWSLILEGLVDVGPSWIRNREMFDPWKTGLYLSAGARLGAMVLF